MKNKENSIFRNTPLESYQFDDPRIEKIKAIEKILSQATKAIKMGDNDSLRDCYMQYQGLCMQFKIRSQFISCNFINVQQNENFKKDFISDINCAITICKCRERSMPKTIANITNSQIQSQQLNVSIIMDKLREYLTEEKFYEIKDLVDKKAKKSEIITKLKGFGLNILASVLANIIML